MSLALAMAGCSDDSLDRRLGPTPPTEPSVLSEITGTITRAGAPIPTARVTLFFRSEVLAVQQVDQNGLYRFSNLESGRLYTLTAEADGFTPRTRQTRPARGQTVRLDFVLEPPMPAQITGTVTRNGTPITDAKVTLDGTNTQNVDQNGAYSFTGLQGGRSYTLTAEANGFQARTRVVTPNAGQTVQLDFVLEPIPMPTQITGTVTYEGRPTITAQVTLDGTNTQDVDQNGAYSFTGLQGGRTYTLTAKAFGHTLVTLQATPAPEQTVQLDFVLEAFLPAFCFVEPSARPPTCGWIEDNMVPLSQVGDFEAFGYITDPAWAPANHDVFYLVSDVALSNIVDYADLLDANTPVPQNLLDVTTPAKRAGTRVHLTLFEPPAAQRAGLTPSSSSPTIPWVSDMVTALDNGGLDGVTLDWEWPATSTQAAEYAGVLRNMRETFDTAFPDAPKRVGYAAQPVIPESFTSSTTYGPWVDHVLVQTYNEAVQGAHGSLLQATSGIQRLIDDGGFAPGLLHMGIPFYAASPNQTAYNAVVDQVYPSQDTAEIDGTSYPIGSPDTVRRRVRHAIDNGLAGVMVWNLNADTRYDDRRSLMRVIASEAGRRYQRPYRPFDGANLIGINFVGGNGVGNDPTPMGDHEVTGLAPQRYWNSLSGPAATGTNLRDGHGQPVDTAIVYQALATNDLGLEDTPGGRRMMSGYLDTDRDSVTTATITGIPYQDYYVLLYHDGDNNNLYTRGRYVLNTFSSTSTQTQYIEDDVTDNTADAPDFDGRFRPQRLVQDLDGFYRWGTANYSMFGMIEGQDAFTLTAQAIDGPPAARGPLNGLQIVDVTQRINLANIVAGGNGFGTETNMGLSGAAPGDVIRTDPEPVVHGSSFPSYKDVPYAYVDRVYTPSGDWAGYVEQPIDGANNLFRFGIDAGVGGPYGTIYSGFGAAGDPPVFIESAGLAVLDPRRFISFGAQNGITFDLNAIRAVHPDIVITAFTAIVGDNRIPQGGNIDYFVFVDGKLAQWDTDVKDTEIFLYVKLPPDARFLSLAITDSADGIDSDRGYFANPFLLFTGTP